MNDKVNIVVCGDICPTQDTEHFFEESDTNGLFNNLLGITNNADISIGNLEFPLTDIGKGIIKSGPVLKGKKKYINVLKEAGFDVLGLANNHIRDCGDEGVLSTLETCEKAGILTVGAGKNETLAKVSLIVEKKGWKIGILAFAEHEFNAASENQAGANIFDVFTNFDEIRELKKQVDYLIILNHGGIEYYKYPSPLLQKKCRKMVECGADLIVCQHSHCIGTEEDYLNGKIVYGQGNTVFGYRENSESWNQGLVLNIVLSDKCKESVSIDYIPVEASLSGINLIKKNKKLILLQKFNDGSIKIQDTEFIKDSWVKFCKVQESYYLPLLLGLGRILNKANRVLNNRIVQFLYTKRKMMIIKNILRCESHNEVIKELLKNK